MSGSSPRIAWAIRRPVSGTVGHARALVARGHPEAFGGGARADRRQAAGKPGPQAGPGRVHAQGAHPRGDLGRGIQQGGADLGIHLHVEAPALAARADEHVTVERGLDDRAQLSARNPGSTTEAM